MRPQPTIARTGHRQYNSLCIFLALFALLPISSLKSQDVRLAPTPRDVDKAIADDFPIARDRLASVLASSYKPGIMGVSGSSGNANFISWLNLWRWCDLLASNLEEELAIFFQKHLFIDKAKNKKVLFRIGVQPDPELETIPLGQILEIVRDQSHCKQLLSELLPEGYKIEGNSLSEVLNQDFLKKIVNDSAFSHSFFNTLSPDDFAPFVLVNLQEIWAAHPNKWKEYQNLAIALAVVYDVKPPAYWPHKQVKQDLVPRENRPIADRFADWVAVNESRGALLDLRKLTPEQLKFVVDAPVLASELEWARKNVRLSRTGFDRAFFQVEYRHDRLDKQQYTWTEDPYLLQTILARGGICVDQAYFAMLAGKARGLPTLFFTGQGADGGHAWFGYMKSDDRWELDCGRYANQNYATGEALDPQTWTPISDHQLKFLAASFRDKPEFSASTNDITVATLLEKSGDSQKAAKAFESAVRTCSMNPDAWKAQGEFLTRSGATIDVRRKLYEDALKQFSNNRDLKVFYQKSLATLAREQGDNTTAEKFEKLVLMQNRRKRADLSVSIAAQQMSALLDVGKLEDAGKEFQKQLNTLSKTGGGNLFYEIVDPYITALIDSGKKEEAMHAIEAARKKLSPEPDSILAHEFDDLKNSAKQ